jgi:serine phosphatase RsbU (regulator of sigma subunit)/CHASE2 domain-containing sensor protein
MTMSSPIRRFVRRVLPVLLLVPVAVAIRPVAFSVLDQRFYAYFQAKRPVPAWRSVAVVGIDAATRREVFPKPIYPLSRHQGPHARLTQRLAQAGVRAIVFDLELSTETFPQPPDSLAEALRAAGMVHLPLSMRESVSEGSRSLSVARRPDPLLVAASRGAFVIDFRIDPDGTIRRFRRDARLDRLGLETMPERLSGFRVTGPVPILFPSLTRPIPQVSYAAVLQGDPAVLATLRDRIVFVGEVGAQAEDFVAVPGLQDVGEGVRTTGLPGVAVLAATTETLLLGAPLRDASSAAVAGWLLAWSLGIAMLIPRRRPLRATFAVLGWIVLALTATGLLQVYGSLVVPGGLLLGALLLSGGYALVATYVETLRDLHASELAAAAMQHELVLARANQERFLPKAMPEIPGCEAWGINVSSAAVSGDYYDVIRRPGQDRVLLAMADVSGKGLPASLVMSSVQAALHSHAMRRDYDLESTVDGLNTLLCESTRPTTFVTMFLGELDPATRRLRFARAGHDLPILISSDGSVRRLEAGGLFLGMFPGLPCPVEEITLSLGDVLCLYTDGVTEARDAKGEEFGIERLEQTLRVHAHQTASQIGTAARLAVEGFSGLTTQADDMTLLVLRVLPGVDVPGD